MSWSVPTRHGAPVQISARGGAVTTIVGANGAGKSALASWMVAQMPVGTAKRLIAHRRIWFTSAGPEINPAQRERHAQNVETWDRGSDSRYADHLDGSRASIALFDLLGMINDQNRQAVEMYDQGSTVDEVLVGTGERLLPKLNRILDNAGLHVSVEVTATQTFLARHKTLGIEYPVFQMSDGEKSALLLAAEVLTAPPGRVIVIDEPERHLHRAISAGLVEAIVAERSDSAFVVLTHDLDLASSLSVLGDTIVLSGCEWSDGAVSAWDLEVLPVDDEVSEIARRAILGGRRQVLFIEGDVGSVDLALYRILYPDWGCTPVGGCESVIKSVTGVRASSNLHWVRAVGIVDGDGRSETQRESLAARGILSLPVAEVENLYYMPVVIEAVARAQAQVTGADAEALGEEARAALLDALRSPGTVDRYAAKQALDEVHRVVADHIPASIGGDNVVISIPSPLAEVREKLSGMLAANDYEGLVRSISIRDSAARARAARAVGFGSPALYEQAARKQLADHRPLRAALRDVVGEFPVDAV